jgi:hypothetical protein
MKGRTMAANDPLSRIYAGDNDEPDADETEPDGKLSREELFRRLFGHYVGPKAKQ